MIGLDLGFLKSIVEEYLDNADIHSYERTAWTKGFMAGVIATYILMTGGKRSRKDKGADIKNQLKMFKEEPSNE